MAELALASLSLEGDPLALFAMEEAQSLFSAESYTGQHAPKNTRTRTEDGRLCIAWRAPSWALPSLPSDLILSSQSSLEALSGRTGCPLCTKSRHYFCYDCLQVLTPLNETPQLTLPFEVDIILHPNERRSMSTGIHAALLAPNSVRIHALTDALPSFDPSSTLLLFPSQSSVPVQSIDIEKIRRVVVVESKWKGTARILSLPELQGVQHVRLDDGVQTSYWRYHTKGVIESALSTIEAIRILCQEWHVAEHGGRDKCHCFDDLLWYFTFFHQIIQSDGSGFCASLLSNMWLKVRGFSQKTVISLLDVGSGFCLRIRG